MSSSTAMDRDKKQEFKDFSLSKDVLINNFSEDEISKLFPPPKIVSIGCLGVIRLYELGH